MDLGAASTVSIGGASLVFCRGGVWLAGCFGNALRPSLDSMLLPSRAALARPVSAFPELEPAQEKTSLQDLVAAEPRIPTLIHMFDSC